MSAVFHLQQRGHTFSVEISRDGSIAFPGYSHEQMEYDKAMVEFGEDPTSELTILYEWRSNPFSVIFEELDIGFRDLLLVVSDHVQHAFRYFRMSSDYHEKIFMRAITISRNLAFYGVESSAQSSSDSAAEVFGVIKEFRSRFVTLPWEAEISDSVHHLIRAAMYYSAHVSSGITTKGDPHTRLWDARRLAAKAVAYGAPRVTKPEDPAWVVYHDIEMAWQIERFVDIMEAIQAGKIFPPMEPLE